MVRSPLLLTSNLWTDRARSRPSVGTKGSERDEDGLVDRSEVLQDIAGHLHAMLCYEFCGLQVLVLRTGRDTLQGAADDRLP